MAEKKARRTKPQQRKSRRSPRRTSRKTKRTVRSRARSGLAGMTLDAIISLRDEAERIIKTRATAQMKVLEGQLARIGRYIGGRPAGTVRAGRRSLKGRKVAPKYQNPANKSETWAGRGARPRWLQSLLREGHKMEEFRVS
jgi:DNA-binding protein H-NS